jgi:hypothetical protein
MEVISKDSPLILPVNDISVMKIVLPAAAAIEVRGFPL